MPARARRRCHVRQPRFSGSNTGVGFEANAGIVLGRWQLGVGYDRTNHDHADTNGDYIVSNVYVEPKLLFAPVRKVTLYGAVRVGRAMASYEGVLGITDKASGYIAGGWCWRVRAKLGSDSNFIVSSPVTPFHFSS